jgi:hypothetical protein
VDIRLTGQLALLRYHLTAGIGRKPNKDTSFLSDQETGKTAEQP